MRKLSLTILLICLVFAGFGKETFCTKKRLTPLNYLSRFFTIKRALIRNLDSKVSPDVFDAIRTCKNTDHAFNQEICAHNRYLFVDQMIYFEQARDFLGYSNVREGEFDLHILRLRDELFRNWMKTLKYQVTTGYVEWEKKDLQKESLSDFLKRGSQLYNILEMLIKPFNMPPGRGKVEPRAEARYAVYHMLEARTIFSSIMPRIGFARLEKTNMGEAILCLNEKIQQMDCRENLYELALQCSDNNHEIAVDLLGILACQRFYFIRDFKGWMEQNMDEATFDKMFGYLVKSSEIYYMIQTYTYECTQSNVFPPDIEIGDGSHKPYHFWSTAALAYHLAAHGFDEEISIREALRPAVKYKRGIKIIAIPYHTILGLKWNIGTRADYKQVMKEQELGAEWGYDLYVKTHNAGKKLPVGRKQAEAGR